MKRAYTRDLIQSFATQCEVNLVGSPQLARLSEAYIRGESVSDDAVMAEIAPCFRREGWPQDRYRRARLHPLSLHGQCLPPPRTLPVDWLDPAEAIARQARRLTPALPEAAEPSGEDIAVFTSGRPDFSTAV